MKKQIDNGMRKIILCYGWMFILSFVLLIFGSCSIQGNDSSQVRTNLGGFDSLRFDHALITVSNYDETLQWYRDKLGATVEKEWTVDELPGIQLSYLKINGRRAIEIIGATQPIAGRAEALNFPEHLSTVGYGHICFQSDDVREVMSQLEKKGVSILVPAADYPAVGLRAGWVKDNNGNVLEFSQPLSTT